MRVEKHLTIKMNYQVFLVADRGVDFVGYRIFPDFILLRSSTANRMKCKLTTMLQKVRSGGELSYSDYCSFNSYLGWIGYCNGYRLYSKYFSPLKSYVEEYYIKHLRKNGGKKNEANKECKIYCTAKSA